MSLEELTPGASSQIGLWCVQIADGFAQHLAVESLLDKAGKIARIARARGSRVGHGTGKRARRVEAVITRCLLVGRQERVLGHPP